MKRIGLTVAALLLPAALVAACGSEDDGGVVSDPTPTSASPTAPSTTPAPTASPTVGTYPPFEPTDYTFQLVVSCFCMGAGVPVRVTVVDAVVVDAVYGADDTGRAGVKAGDPADKYFRKSINDVIDAANDTDAARVEVDWPAGQDYPNSVYVDGQENAADDEIGYTISDVQVG